MILFKDLCTIQNMFSEYLDLHSSTHEKILIPSDFNLGTEEQHMKSFCKRLTAYMLQKSR